MIDCLAKGPVRGAIQVDSGLNLADAIRGESAIAVQEQQNVTGCLGRSLILLTGAALRGLEEGRSGFQGYFARRVSASAIDDDHLERTSCFCRRYRLTDILRFV